MLNFTESASNISLANYTLVNPALVESLYAGWLIFLSLAAFTCICSISLGSFKTYEDRCWWKKTEDWDKRGFMRRKCKTFGDRVLDDDFGGFIFLGAIVCSILLFIVFIGLLVAWAVNNGDVLHEVAPPPPPSLPSQPNHTYPVDPALVESLRLGWLSFLGLTVFACTCPVCFCFILSYTKEDSFVRRKLKIFGDFFEQQQDACEGLCIFGLLVLAVLFLLAFIGLLSAWAVNNGDVVYELMPAPPAPPADVPFFHEEASLELWCAALGLIALSVGSFAACTAVLCCRRESGNDLFARNRLDMQVRVREGESYARIKRLQLAERIARAVQWGIAPPCFLLGLGCIAAWRMVKSPSMDGKPIPDMTIVAVPVGLLGLPTVVWCLVWASCSNNNPGGVEEKEIQSDAAAIDGSIVYALQQGTIRLLSAAWLRSSCRSHPTMRRLQDLPEAAFLSEPDAALAHEAGKVFALS